MINWEERLGKWADKLEAAGDKTVDFASAEIPEYIREVLAWEFWSSAMAAVGCLFGLLVLVVLMWKFFCYMKKTDALNDPEFIFPAMFGACALLALTCALLDNTSKAVKVKVAPRVVIMDKVKDQLRK